MDKLTRRKEKQWHGNTYESQIIPSSGRASWKHKKDGTSISTKPWNIPMQIIYVLILSFFKPYIYIPRRTVHCGYYTKQDTKVETSMKRWNGMQRHSEQITSKLYSVIFFELLRVFNQKYRNNFLRPFSMLY